MTRQEAINRAKHNILISLTRCLDTSNVTNAIAFFASDFCDFSTEHDLDRINEEVDAVIGRLNMLKSIVNESREAIVETDNTDADN